MTITETALGPRYEALRRNHAAIKFRIRREQSRAVPDALNLQRLKRERLRLKDEMARLAGALTRPGRALGRSAA